MARNADDQAKDPISAVEDIINNFKFEDFITSVGMGLSKSNSQLSDDYIKSMNEIMYTETTISKASKALQDASIESIPGLDFLGPGMGMKLFSAGLETFAGGMEVAYINVEVEKPVTSPNGETTKTKMNLKMPRFLMFDQKPLSISDAKLFFRMKLDTVYRKNIDSHSGSENLGLRTSIRSTSSTPNTPNEQSVIGETEFSVTVNFKEAKEAPIGHQILQKVFSEHAVPIDKSM